MRVSPASRTLWALSFVVASLAAPVWGAGVVVEDPVAIALTDLPILNLLGAKLDNSSTLLLYETDASSNSSLRAAVVDEAGNPLANPTILAPLLKTVQAQATFANGEGSGGVLWIEGNTVKLRMFTNGSFAEPIQIPISPRVASACKAAMAGSVAIACTISDPRGMDPAEVHLYRMTPNGTILGGASQVSSADARYSDILGVAFDAAENIWVEYIDRGQPASGLGEVYTSVLIGTTMEISSPQFLQATVSDASFDAMTASPWSDGVLVAIPEAQSLGNGTVVNLYELEANPQALPKAINVGRVDGDLWRICISHEASSNRVLVAALSLRPEADNVSNEIRAEPAFAIVGPNSSVVQPMTVVEIRLPATTGFVLGGSTFVSWGAEAQIVRFGAAGRVLPPTEASHEPPGFPLPAWGVSVAAAFGILVPMAFLTERGRDWLLLVFSPLVYRAAPRSGKRGDTKRALILLIILERPGIHYSELVRRSSLAHGVVEHHLRRLESQGSVRRIHVGNKITYYPAETSVRSLPSHGSSSDRILHALRESPGSTRKDLSTTLRLRRTTLDYNLNRLLAKGLIVEYGKGFSEALTMEANKRDQGSPSGLLPPVTIRPDRARAAFTPPPVRRFAFQPDKFSGTEGRVQERSGKEADTGVPKKL